MISDFQSLTFECTFNSKGLSISKLLYSMCKAKVIHQASHNLYMHFFSLFHQQLSLEAEQTSSINVRLRILLYVGQVIRVALF